MAADGAGDGVIATRVQRVATGQAGGGQPETAQWAMLCDGAHRIFRAAGHETATGAKHRADEGFIDAQQDDEQS
ncbi:hypothetical protein ABB25_07400 [Stenotrophomonas koreensis]|uniref:Uncharacterized protein n=1 Tax=Stenotrophomonas koreensis TaxID=266128 RepID=A0A0R0BMA1_9GAMM|nr:hypothetical protein ABB25_07400 [Stenotrophomonas koreensis]